MTHPGPCKGEGCPSCELFRTSDFHNRLWGGPGLPHGRQLAVPAPETPAPDCPHLGRELTGPEREAAGLDHARRWALCTHPATPLGPHVCPCKGCGPTCPGYPRAEAEPPPAPLSLTDVGPDGLAKGRSGWAFNAGLVRYQGRLLMSYRTDWAGAHCHIAELAEDYAVRRSVVLPHLAHPAASYGREDPRLFVFRERLHIWYVGVVVVNGKTHTNQLYARLTDDLQVEEVFYPEYQYRREWEKNWSPFGWMGELFVVYSIAPHVVLHVRGNKAYPFTETPTEFPWSGGHLRGGAPPVLVGDRFYHWFHGRRDSDWVYNVGLYTFEARPPFRVLSMTPDPVLWGDPADTDGNYCSVRFPQGAVLENNVWKVSMGWNDRRIRIAEWDAAAADAALAARR